MPFHLECECGQTREVGDGLAGSTLRCSCGRSLEVPSITRPVLTPSPEFVLETLLQADRLPQETTCVQCQVETSQAIVIMAECAKAQVARSGIPGWVQVLLLWWLVGPLVTLVLGKTVREHSQVENEWGKDVIFPLPLRICERCAPNLTSNEAIRNALWRIPTYRDLLEKYPNATLYRQKPSGA
jgi:hypothetical protein